MGRTPCCDKKGMKKGPWSPEEDQLLLDFITANGHGSWRSLPKQAGLLRCGKSCRLRWINYLRPDIKRGPFTPEEEKLVIQLHAILGNKWASIAAQLPGRTDNEIKNLWNTHLRKRLISMGLDPQTHKPTECPIHNILLATSPSTRHMAQWESARLEAEARLSKDSLLLVPTLAPRTKTNTDTDHFLCLWHSEVGESFRKIKEDDQNQNQTLKTLCQSPISQASVSGMTTIEMKPAKVEPTRSNENEEAECKSRSFYIDTSSSNEIEDSSDTALQLFFDYHEQNDMTFLEEHSNDYSIYP